MKSKTALDEAIDRGFRAQPPLAISRSAFDALASDTTTDDTRIGHEIDAIEAVRRVPAEYTAPVVDSIRASTIDENGFYHPDGELVLTEPRYGVTMTGVRGEPETPAPAIPNEDQFTKLDPIERANVVKPIVEIGERYKRAFGGWRLLGEVMASQEQTPALWSGAALMCRAADDRRGTQFCTLMAVVADSVRLEVLKALR